MRPGPNEGFDWRVCVRDVEETVDCQQIMCRYEYGMLHYFDFIEALQMGGSSS